MNGDALGDRMKGYERASRLALPRRMPVIIRVDGKAFHTLTQDLRRPFCRRFMSAMDETAIALCEEIQGAVFAYVQSDEISVLVHNYKRLNTDAWFDNDLQKIVSVSAAAAAAHFSFDWGAPVMFDARAFVLPEAEVCNYFIWRQQDATRNSLQMAARSVYSHRALDGKKTPELHEMLHAEGINWNDYPTSFKRGRGVGNWITGWEIDNETPIFTQDRQYIEHWLVPEET